MAERREITIRRSAAGFTLIELLLIMLILALTASVAALNAPPLRSAIQTDAERLAATLTRTSDEAVVTGAPMRIEITPQYFAVSAFANGEWSDGGRLGFADGAVISVDIGDAAFANIDLLADGENREDDAPQYILIDPAGVSTDAEIGLRGPRGAWRVSFVGGKTTVTRDDA